MNFFSITLVPDCSSALPVQYLQSVVKIYLYTTMFISHFLQRGITYITLMNSLYITFLMLFLVIFE